jgi:hypothetical protein
MSARLSLPPSPASPPLLSSSSLPSQAPSKTPSPPLALSNILRIHSLCQPYLIRAKLTYNGVSEIKGDLAASALAHGLSFLSRPSDMVRRDTLRYGSAGTLEMRLAVLFASSVYVPRHIGSFTTNSQQQAERFAAVVWCIAPHKTTGAVSLGIVFCAGHLKDWHRKK